MAKINKKKVLDTLSWMTEHATSLKDMTVEEVKQVLLVEEYVRQLVRKYPIDYKALADYKKKHIDNPKL